MATNPEVLISEVGPRDGLQSIRTVMPTERKIAWLDALAACGLREIEVGSFVPARLLPQMADTEVLVRHGLRWPDITVVALVPNVHGARAALAAGAHKLTVPVSASEAHSMANVRKTCAQMVVEVKQIIALRDTLAPGARVEVGLSTAFGCTLQGEVPEDQVLRLAEALAAAGVGEIGLSDTTGMANPAQVRRLFTRLKAAIGPLAGAAHLHNTRGLGLANCLAAYDVGVRTFDSSLGGLGGCPYAPGASGNVVTEDLVFMFEAMGIPTGVDIPGLLRAREVLAEGLPGEPLYGMTPEAGVPKHFVPARQASTAGTPHQAMPATAASSTVAAVPVRPLAGVRVVELTHMVMGPTCGLILADLGAEVIKVEPLAGDSTRRLLGSGSGFFGAFNRNKKSLALDLKQPAGREIMLRLLAGADIFSENFKSGTVDALGLDAATLFALNPRLISVSHKGFLPGPYAQRTALDEVVQMMGGLAYMTGPEGRPLRAGTSVNDIMGGMFGAIGAMAALIERARTGRGQVVQSALFENNVLLVAQHMMQFAVTGKPAAPMPSRISAWAVYDVFSVRDGGQIFLAAVSDTQWRLMCESFGFSDLLADTRLSSNNARVQSRDWMLPLLRERFAHYSAEELAARFDGIGLPYAPITAPHALLDDPHLAATGGLADVNLPADASSAGRPLATRMPLLPLTLGGQRLGVQAPPPSIGEHTRSVLTALGYGPETIDDFVRRGVVGGA